MSNEQLSNSNQLLKDISELIERNGGTESKLLNTIIDSLNSNNGVTQSIDSNIKSMNQSIKSIESSISDQVNNKSLTNGLLTDLLKENQKLKEEIIKSNLEKKTLLEKALEKQSTENEKNNSELKQELIELKEEMRLMRDAITEVMPTKLGDIFKVFIDNL